MFDIFAAAKGAGAHAAWLSGAGSSIAAITPEAVRPRSRRGDAEDARGGRHDRALARDADRARGRDRVSCRARRRLSAAPSGPPDDLDTIISLVRGLAEYEREPDAVRIDRDEFARNLFGPHPYAEVILAADEAGETVGFALFFHNFSTWTGKPGIWLEDLFVRPGQRGHGHGRALLAELARIAVERGCGRFEWSVLDWNEPSIRFYRRPRARGRWTNGRPTEWRARRWSSWRAKVAATGADYSGAERAASAASWPEQSRDI